MTNGWKCPVCGAGVAPSVERCPCASAQQRHKDDRGGLDSAMNKALEELEKQQLEGVERVVLGKWLGQV